MYSSTMGISNEIRIRAIAKKIGIEEEIDNIQKSIQQIEQRDKEQSTVRSRARRRGARRLGCAGVYRERPG